MAQSDRPYDVIILGSGLAGSTLASILARHGHSVLVLEAGSHPRFAVGESVVPEFSVRAKLLAATFDVPELAYLSNFQLVRHHVSANSGIKRNFTFLYHRPDEEHRPLESFQFQAMTPPLGPDCHMYRPDLDAWLTALSVRYGAHYRERTAVDDVDLEGGESVSVTAGGKRYRGRFLVDGTGYRSVIAQKLGLRPEPAFGTDSRTLFTHMVGVRSAALALPSLGRSSIPSPPDQGTLHHIFDGGWFWIIPFDNHSRAVNPICSVGLTLERAKFGDNDLDPEEEFFEIVSRFPSVRRQLEGARAVRSWVKTARLQYRSPIAAGDRWCLMPHAAGFIDPLFSGGMVLTLSGVHETARTLLPALADGDLGKERFNGLERFSGENLTMLDRVVHGAYIAFRSPALFNAWFRFWAIGNYHGSASLVRVHLKYLASRRKEDLELAYHERHRLVLGCGQPKVRALIESGYEALCRHRDGELSESQCVDRLFGLLEEAKSWVPPHFHAADRTRTHLASFTVFPLISMILWGKRNAPPDVREACYDVGPIFFRELTRSLVREARWGLGAFLRVFRAAHFTRGRS